MVNTITKKEAKAYNLEDVTDLSLFGKSLHETCRGFYKPIHDRHQKAWDFYIGKQWRVYRRRGLAMVVFNIVGPHMDIIASNLTDSQIVFQVIPKAPDANELSEIWSEILRMACEQDRFTVQMYGGLLDSLVKGYSVFKVTHDTDRMIPTCLEVIDPYNYMGEPGVRRPDIDGNYHWHSEWMTALQVRDMFPEKWQELKYAAAGNETDIDSYEMVYERGGDRDYTHMVLIHELYMRTDATEPIPDKITQAELNSEHEEFQQAKSPRVVLEQDHPKHAESHEAQIEEIAMKIRQKAMQARISGQALSETGQPMNDEEFEAAVQKAIAENPIIKFIYKHNEEHAKMYEDNPRGHRLKYNGWRRVVYGGPDFYVLDDDETPYTDEEGRGIHPFCIMTTQDTATDIYNWSVLERCMSLQEMVNLWMSRFTDYLGLFATPYMVIDMNAMTVEPNQITPIAGAIIPVNKNPNEVVKWIQPPAMAGALIEGFYQNVKHIEKLTGVSDVETGQYPQGMDRTSRPVIESLQQASRARWREYQREYEDFLRRVGIKLMGVIQTYMTEQMQIRVGGLKEAYPILNAPQEDKDGNMTYLNDMTVGRYDVRIKLTPLTSLTPEAKMNKAMALYTAANPVTGITIYDLEAVADEVEDAVTRKSVNRQKMKQQQAEQMQQQEAQAKQQTKGAG